MPAEEERQDLRFTENGALDIGQLNDLYRLVGWDSRQRRTEAETLEMLRRSAYFIAAETAQGTLAGFARVCGDPYVVQVLDVITHPAHRRRGIATRCMAGVLSHLRQSRYLAVTLTHSQTLGAFYARFGFHAAGADMLTRAWRREPASQNT